MKQGNQVFLAKVNTGTKEKPNWELRGTVVIRQGGTGGVLFLKTGELDANDKPVDMQVALFPKRAKKADGAPPKAA